MYAMWRGLLHEIYQLKITLILKNAGPKNTTTQKAENPKTLKPENPKTQESKNSKIQKP